MASEGYQDRPGFHRHLCPFCNWIWEHKGRFVSWHICPDCGRTADRFATYTGPCLPGTREPEVSPQPMRTKHMNENETGNVATPDEPLPIRFSYLKALGRSPAHCKLAMDKDKYKLAEEPNVAMERGTALHHVVLGTRKVIGYTEGKVRRGKEWEMFQEVNAGALILTAGEYETVARMGEAVGMNDLAFNLIHGGIFEQTHYWHHVGRKCRGTVDVLGMDHIADLKTCEDSRPFQFAWATRRYSYHAQMAWYVDGIGKGRARTHAKWKEPTSAFIIAVESKPPYPVTVLKLTDRALELGRKQYSLWLERFMACEQSGEWPGYAQSIVDLDVPEDDTELVFEEDGESS
jgi:hypothetical protein